MLVVLVIAGILISAATLTISRNPRTALFEEGERLALLFETAAEEAQLRASPISWQPTSDGYVFFVRHEDRWQRLNESLFTPQRWQASVNAVTMHYPGRQDNIERVVFGTESVETPVVVTLYANTAQVSVVGNGSGHYTVR
jgi:general secretion pathway protein H